MGIRDSDSNNNWKYASNNQTVSWTNWNPGSPDNFGGLPENCVNTGSKGSSKWKDGTCSYNFQSICELTTEKKGMYSVHCTLA